MLLLEKKKNKIKQDGRRESADFIRFLAKRQIRRYKRIQEHQILPINKMSYQHKINAISDLIEEINEYQPIKNKVLCRK